MAPSSTTRTASSGQQGERRTRLMMVLVGVLVLGFVVLIAALSAGERGSRVTVDDIAGSPAIEGAGLSPGGQDPANDPDVGRQAPVVTGEDFDGTPVTIGEPGTPQLIVFMASWCPACQQELTAMTPWLREGNLRDDVALVAVSTLHDATRPNWPPDAWFESEGFEHPVLVDDADGSVAQAYGLTATPYWVAVDGEGRVVARIAGMLPTEQVEILANTVAG